MDIKWNIYKICNEWYAKLDALNITIHAENSEELKNKLIKESEKIFSINTNELMHLSLDNGDIILMSFENSFNDIFTIH